MNILNEKRKGVPAEVNLDPALFSVDINSSKMDNGHKTVTTVCQTSIIAECKRAIKGDTLERGDFTEHFFRLFSSIFPFKKKLPEQNRSTIFYRKWSLLPCASAFLSLPFRPSPLLLTLMSFVLPSPPDVVGFWHFAHCTHYALSIVGNCFSFRKTNS